MIERNEQVRAIIADEAGDWFVAHRTGTLGAAQRRAFEAWVMASPIHVEEYLGVARIAAQLPEAGKDPEMPPDVLIERVRQQGPTRLSTLRAAPRAPAETTRRTLAAVPWRFAAVAATIAVAVSTLLWFSGDRIAPVRYATQHGKMSTVRLADGSVLRLNTDTAVTVRYGRADRVVELDHGQAFFEVAHESDRPFRVVAGHAAVTAVGTQFDAYRRDGSTLVTVVEGQVAVSPTGAAPGDARGAARWEFRVAAGEELRVVDNAVPASPAPAPPGRATAWLRRQIVAEREPLAAIAAEFNRYSTRPIDIETPQLRTLVISGVFSSDDPDTFIAFLRTLDGVVIELTPTRIRVHAVANPAGPDVRR